MRPHVGDVIDAHIPEEKEDEQNRSTSRGPEMGTTEKAFSIHALASGISLSLKNVSCSVVSALVEVYSIFSRILEKDVADVRRPCEVKCASEYDCGERK